VQVPTILHRQEMIQETKKQGFQETMHTLFLQDMNLITLQVDAVLLRQVNKANQETRRLSN